MRAHARVLLVAVGFGFLGASPSRAEDAAPAEVAPDAFAQALADMGLEEGDLGIRPEGTWNRYPLPATTPYRLPFVDDLLAHPLGVYEFSRTLGNSVEDLLTPEKLTAAPTKDDPAETLFRLGVLLGTERRIGGFRGYSANLDPRPSAQDPLFHALVTLLERSGGAPRREGSFGSGAKADDDPHSGLRKDLAAVPADLHLPLARLVLNLIDAHEWIDRGLRRVPQALREEVFRLLPRLASDDTADGIGYPAVIDDVARLLDEESLYYGCLKALQAVHDARREIAAAAGPEGTGKWAHFRFHVRTPWGRVAVGEAPDREQADLLFVGFGAPTREGRGPLVIPEPARGETVEIPIGGSFGATGVGRCLSVGLLFDGPVWIGEPPAWTFEGEGTEPSEADVREGEGTAAVARGVLGCGILYGAGAIGSGYRCKQWGLGAGLFGLGVLVDEGGNDRYLSASSGTGCGMFGAGLLLDASGDDEYRLSEGDGQGCGLPNGVGVLADRSGNDTYYAEPDASKAGRADYHSEKKIAANNAQGAGMGRRGDGSDGHNWAGGLGALLDVEGDDRYTAGNFTQGIGYWYGTGILWDGGGNDEYRSVYFTQGSGAHFAVGALIDEGGNDQHVLGETAGAALGFGWDAVVAWLLDRGDGNDRYVAKNISMGTAEVRSHAFFVDEGGNDEYVLEPGRLGLGAVDSRPDYETPRRDAPFTFHLPQVAMFLDLGGTDRYLRGETPDPDAGDGKSWRVRTRDRSSRAAYNLSLGRDVERGRAGFLDPWPARR